MISDLQTDAADVGKLHARILDAWNRQDASAYAESCTDDAIVIGFDGSEMHGRQEIADQLGGIFDDHQVASYVGVVRSVRSLGKDVALLHAVVGMVAPGQEDVMPDRNAVQLLLATHTDGEWRAQALQNTPARYDARPEAARALTDELQARADG